MKNHSIKRFMAGCFAALHLLVPQLAAQDDEIAGIKFKEVRDAYNARHDEIRKPLQQLTLSYEGRQTGDARTVHVGRAAGQAFF